ncbi:Carboxylic ester hydrolase [Pleurostoma richardsiae]|uniref:Carboxylic ester hydrolase n=1 Tax=Pleurostoma richardsiae TaxID=41990 RepID=A0AA38VQ16_9PEZI|nr:Carboxylic ester hydrolase [Pleurostoma richardsiae]
MTGITLAAAFGLLLALLCKAVDAAIANCQYACRLSTFQKVLPPEAVVESVAVVHKEGSYGEGAANIAYPVNPTGLPALCAVTVNVTSSPDSSYRFGLFLPVKWNSKFLAVGNGGFAGGINWLDMGPGPHYGFATLSTDTGHNSTTADLVWAHNNPEKQIDWGWRALHGSVKIGKKLTAAYYGRSIKYSYYSGCSTGGRQGMKEMQIAPDSFDGVLVGAPAWYTKRLNVYVTELGIQNLPTSDPKHIPVSVFSVIAEEVVRQCDGDDGVADGIVSSPEACNFDFAKIQCGNPGVNASACLTPAQIQTAKNVYGDYLSATGEFLYTGLTYSSEDQWYILLGGTQPSPFGIGYE